MSISGIQGHLLEVTVVGCSKLKDTEWISRQDPYVCVEYGSTKFRTRTCTDGGKTPTFQEKFVFTLIEGLRELNVVVWNSNTLTFDDFIGNGKIQLQKVLSQGFDDSPWTLLTKSGRYAGEVRVIMHYENANKSATSFAPSAPPYVTPPMPQVSLYSAPSQAYAAYSAPSQAYAAYTAPLQASAAYSALPKASAAPYPPPATAYPSPSPYPSYPPHPASYPPSPYPPSHPAAYPPQPYPPPSVYPPPAYPPPPQDSPYHYPPGPYHGVYPPPPY